MSGRLHKGVCKTVGIKVKPFPSVLFFGWGGGRRFRLHTSLILSRMSPTKSKERSDATIQSCNKDSGGGGGSKKPPEVFKGHAPNDHLGGQTRQMWPPMLNFLPFVVELTPREGSHGPIADLTSPGEEPEPGLSLVFTPLSDRSSDAYNLIHTSGHVDAS